MIRGWVSGGQGCYRRTRGKWTGSPQIREWLGEWVASLTRWWVFLLFSVPSGLAWSSPPDPLSRYFGGFSLAHLAPLGCVGGSRWGWVLHNRIPCHRCSVPLFNQESLPSLVSLALAPKPVHVAAWHLPCSTLFGVPSAQYRVQRPTLQRSKREPAEPFWPRRN